MMRRLLFITAALCAALTAQAQKIGEFRTRLAEPYIDDATGRVSRVYVREEGSAAEAVRIADARPAERSVGGFRIVVFFDNGSSARADAEKAILSFKALYPEIYCGIRYENPYFKVVAGNCITSEDAIMLLARIRPNFPEAYIMREEIKLSSLAAEE